MNEGVCISGTPTACGGRIRTGSTKILLAVVMLLAVAGQAATAAPQRDPANAADREVDRPASELERPPSWSIPTRADVRRQLLEWLDTVAATAPADAVTAVREAWRELEPAENVDDLLDLVMDSFARIDPRCAALQRSVGENRETVPADVEWLTGSATAAFERDAVRLWLGRERVRSDRFDDGLALLADLDPATAVDPAALLFHRAACQHWLLDSDVAVETLDRLLERSGEIPVRYERVARLLRADIAALEDESLDHIARRMRDITRRLDLGRAGPRTLAVQDGVIDSLDKLIKAIEQQQQQQQQQSQSSGGAGGGGNSNDGTPMDDSRIAGGKGAGEVTKRDIGDTDGWGKLPPHKREEALQQIGREFPAHYREAIEQYFKRLASGEEKR
ncbi:MAG: hypothetical protein ACKO6B_07715 [Planctomycetia bacterium]